MREIAAAAGIRESLLYHYFPAKRDILGELVIFNTKLLREVDRRVTIATRRTYACRPFLRAVGREYLHYVFQAHELLVLWLMGVKEFRSGSDELVSIATRLHDKLGKRLGALPDYRSPDDPVLVIRFFLAAIYVTCVYRIRIGISLPNIRDYSDLVDAAVDFAAHACSSS